MLVCVTSHWVCTLRTLVILCVPSLVWTFSNMVLLCVPSLFQNFHNRVLMSVPSQDRWSRRIWVFMSSSCIYGWSWKIFMLMIITSLNCRYLQALLFESFPWLMFPGSGAVRFIFLPSIYRYSFDVSLWWNGCIPMSFTSLVDISILWRTILVLLLVFELGKVRVVVYFLLVYLVVLYLWAGVLVWHPVRFFVFVMISLSLCVWWWLLCGPLCVSSHGTLCVGSHWSRIHSCLVVGKHDWVGFGPSPLMNWLALLCIWISIHGVWIHFELWILLFLLAFFSFSWGMFAVLGVAMPFGCFGVWGIECPESRGYWSWL